MGNIGYFALLVAFVTALYSALAFIFAARLNSRGLISSARNGLIAVTSLVSFAIIILVYATFSHDFSLLSVAEFTSRSTSPIYLFSSIWAGNSGALLLWLWILCIFSLVVFFRKHNSQKALIPYVGMVLMLTQAFLVLLLVLFANPFTAGATTPADGLGAMIATQTVGMVLHPPALIAGYAGFTIPFAFAISALLTGKTDDDWLTTSRRWLILAWILLGIGNIIGAWWAYMELGWGGYWAWDPVENASLMPWLMATAFLHSSIMQRRNGQFKVWSLVLIVLTFGMILFGAFLTRSNIPGSNHTFSDTAQMGPYFLTFIALILVGSLFLIYRRYDSLKAAGNSEILNKPTTFILNNILLIASVVFTFAGTIYPWLSSASGATAVIKPTSFNKVNGSIFLLIILLIGICTVIGWKRSSLKELGRKILWPFVAALIAGVLILLFARREPAAVLAFFVLVFVGSNILLDWLKAARTRARARGENFLMAGWRLPWANSQRYGGYLVHISILLIAVGVIGSSFFPTQKASTLKVGDSVQVNQYTFTYKGSSFSTTPETETVKATISVFNSASLLTTLTPEITYQTSRDQSGPEVAVRSTPIEDIYIRMDGISTTSNTADFTFLINPLVVWIWIGGGVFLLGGLMTFWPMRRSRISSSAEPLEPVAPETNV